MSAACAPSEVIAMAHLHHLPDREAGIVLDLCQAMDEGAHDGQTLAYPGEPRPLKKREKDPDPEPLEVEEYIHPAALASEAIDLLDEAEVGALLVELNPGGRLTLWELMKECRVSPSDLWPRAQQDTLSLAMTGRELRFVPHYFSDPLLRYGVEDVFANVMDPASLEAARSLEVEERWR